MMRRDYFMLDGRDCRTLGLHVAKLPGVIVPQERVTYETVPARSGALTVLEGDQIYEDVIYSFDCWAEEGVDAVAVSQWLQGEHELEIPNQPGGVYRARLNNQISIAQVLRTAPQRTMQINFRCKPFWYEIGVDDIEITAAGSVVNPGTVNSQPVITVYGSGNIDLMIGGQTVILSNIVNGKPYRMDSEAMESFDIEFDDTLTSANGKMNGEYFVLQPGTSAVSWSGTVTKIVIEPHWRYLTGWDA